MCTHTPSVNCEEGSRNVDLSAHKGVGWFQRGYRKSPWSLSETLFCPRSFICEEAVVYYESRKRELKIRLMNEGRCDERLKARVEESTCLTYTGLYDKTN